MGVLGLQNPEVVTVQENPLWSLDTQADANEQSEMQRTEELGTR